MAVFTLTSLSTIVRRPPATPILSSLSKKDENNNTSPSPRPVDRPRPINTVIPPQQSPIRSQSQKQRKPSISQIERAIGAGDRDSTIKDSGMNTTLFDPTSSNSTGWTEGNVEKKLRETGEWLIDRTEGSSSVGKNVLKVLFQLLLPMWILSVLVASGVIKLPFSSPFIDDLIM